MSNVRLRSSPHSLVTSKIVTGTMEIKSPSIDAALDVQDHQNFDPRPALSHAASSFWSTLSSSGKAASVSVSAAMVVSMNSTTSARNSHTMEPSESV